MRPNRQDQARKSAIQAFVRDTFGLRGSYDLHRVAFGWDMLRAPANVVLGPVFLLARLAGLLARRLGWPKLAAWLLGRKVLLDTDVSRAVAAKMHQFLTDLDQAGIGVSAPPPAIAREVENYTSVRSAVAEIATSVLVLIGGYAVFHLATPGVFSLAGQVAEMRAHADAVDQFPLGRGLGRMYYGVFSAHVSPWQLVLTGLFLAMFASIVTTFAGVIVDPIQVITGTHRRRLSRLVARLSDPVSAEATLPREHVAARLADVGDVLWNIWRGFRG